MGAGDFNFNFPSARTLPKRGKLIRKGENSRPLIDIFLLAAVNQELDE